MVIIDGDATERELKRLRDACSRENDAICQTLGTALGYPRYCDDQANFPGATPTDGVCVREHVAATLAQEAAERIGKLTTERDKAKDELAMIMRIMVGPLEAVTAEVEAMEPGKTKSAWLAIELANKQANAIAKARENRALRAEVERLKAAVQAHHDQAGDDRCHLDDLKLYREVLGEGVDPYVGALPPDADMEESCRRYIQQRRCPGGVVPLPEGMTIQQLTDAYAKSQAEVERLKGNLELEEAISVQAESEVIAKDREICQLRAERDRAKAEADRMDAALREIEERLRTRTRPILDMLQQHQTDEAINSWKHAVYGSCIHAQLMMRTKAAGLNESKAG